ncbi:MAG TPA: sulfotransferase [Gammaproteobacteria bacterium]|nr:sulfotransferase [Gammaproteobacteria bacterium]
MNVMASDFGPHNSLAATMNAGQQALPHPIFVVGSYRSGTSIFAWCLGQHPNIVNLPETNWLYRFTLTLPELYRLGTVNGRHSHLGQIGLSEDGFFAHMGQVLDAFIRETNTVLIARTEAAVGRKNPHLRRRRSPDEPKARWVDATPENSHYVLPLARLFPGARFIHLLRDPHAVARSLMKFSTVGGAARDYERDEAYRAWLRLVRACVAAENALGPDRVLRIRYEDLIAEPEDTLKRCLGFVGEQWAPACLEPLQRKINSSSVEATTNGGEAGEISAVAREADDYFRGLIEMGQKRETDAEALAELERTFSEQCAAVTGARSMGENVEQAPTDGARSMGGNVEEVPPST